MSDIIHNKVELFDFFLPDLYYTRSPELLPGSWLNKKKIKTDRLTILLPLQSSIRNFFSSEYLEKYLSIEPVTIDQKPGIKLCLKINLNGVSNFVEKSFVLKNENELPDDYPSVALWPNLPSSSGWQEFFLFESVLDSDGEPYAFQIGKPSADAQQTIRNFGQEKYHYWQCAQRPDILDAIDQNGKLLGVIPLKPAKLRQKQTDTWTVGVDFNPSITNIYFRQGNKMPERFQLESNLLKVTLGFEVKFSGFHDYIYRNFFIPDVLIPRDNLPPMSTALITCGWQEEANTIPKIITEARIYNPRSNGEFSGYAKININWENVEYQEPFLAQLARMIAIQASLENVKNIKWRISYPCSFSQAKLNSYLDIWERIIADLSSVSGQYHILDKVLSENMAFALYFCEILSEPIIHTTCISIQETTSVLSFWNNNQLIHKAKIPYAGRDLLHNILRENLDYFDEIFGLSQGDLEKLRKSLSSDPLNFNSIIDIRLRMEGENSEDSEAWQPSLANGYRINKKKERNRQFRSLLAFGYCGLFHYIGLVQKWLKQEGLMTEDHYTSLLLGGNGSRFVHLLSESGRLQSYSEVNYLIKEILISSSELTSNPNLLNISRIPQQEICAGLAVQSTRDMLIDMPIKINDNLFLGESCIINGRKFLACERLTLDDEWNEITEFTVTSTAELETYLRNFNRIIKEHKIEEIEPLRDYQSGNLLKITDDLRKLLRTNLTQQCLRQKGPKEEFEPDPPFLMALKAFLAVLAKEWSKSR